jgi:hypothetical protein
VSQTTPPRALLVTAAFLRMATHAETRRTLHALLVEMLPPATAEVYREIAATGTQGVRRTPGNSVFIGRLATLELIRRERRTSERGTMRTWWVAVENS